MKIETDIDIAKLGLQKKEGLEEAYKSLSKLYGLIWCEAFYDPTNEKTQDFATKLLPLIKQANKTLGFSTTN